jgi:hypothetical protein
LNSMNSFRGISELKRILVSYFLSYYDWNVILKGQLH